MMNRVTKFTTILNNSYKLSLSRCKSNYRLYSTTNSNSNSNNNNNNNSNITDSENNFNNNNNNFNNTTTLSISNENESYDHFFHKESPFNNKIINFNAYDFDKKLENKCILEDKLNDFSNLKYILNKIKILSYCEEFGEKYYASSVYQSIFIELIEKDKMQIIEKIIKNLFQLGIGRYDIMNIKDKLFWDKIFSNIIANLIFFNENVLSTISINSNSNNINNNIKEKYNKIIQIFKECLQNSPNKDLNEFVVSKLLTLYLKGSSSSSINSEKFYSLAIRWSIVSLNSLEISPLIIYHYFWIFHKNYKVKSNLIETSNFQYWDTLLQRYELLKLDHHDNYESNLNFQIEKQKIKNKIENEFFQENNNNYNNNPIEIINQIKINVKNNFISQIFNENNNINNNNNSNYNNNSNEEIDKLIENKEIDKLIEKFSNEQFKLTEISKGDFIIKLSECIRREDPIKHCKWVMEFVPKTMTPLLIYMNSYELVMYDIEKGIEILMGKQVSSKKALFKYSEIHDPKFKISVTIGLLKINQFDLASQVLSSLLSELYYRPIKKLLSERTTTKSTKSDYHLKYSEIISILNQTKYFNSFFNKFIINSNYYNYSKELKLLQNRKFCKLNDFNFNFIVKIQEAIKNINSNSGGVGSVGSEKEISINELVPLPILNLILSNKFKSVGKSMGAKSFYESMIVKDEITLDIGLEMLSKRHPIPPIENIYHWESIKNDYINLGIPVDHFHNSLLRILKKNNNYENNNNLSIIKTLYENNVFKIYNLSQDSLLILLESYFDPINPMKSTKRDNDMVFQIFQQYRSTDTLNNSLVNYLIQFNNIIGNDEIYQFLKKINNFKIINNDRPIPQYSDSLSKNTISYLELIINDDIIIKKNNN
ncbi:hypothetical protein ACTFIR_000112 [Dictyostelium discoideum]